jgi:hypothetical protein
MAHAILDGTGSGFLAKVNSDNRLQVDLGGDIIISGVNIDSIVIQETSPIDENKNNPAWKLEYDSNNNVGSVTQFIDAGSFVNVLTWQGYSGTTIGLGSRVTNIGSYF